MFYADGAIPAGKIIHILGMSGLAHDGFSLATTGMNPSPTPSLPDVLDELWTFIFGKGFGPGQNVLDKHGRLALAKLELQCLPLGRANEYRVQSKANFSNRLADYRELAGQEVRVAFPGRLSW